MEDMKVKKATRPRVKKGKKQNRINKIQDHKLKKR